MAKSLSLLLVAVVMLACSERQPEPPAIRESIGTLYVGDREAVVREQPDEKAKEVARYKAGEAVSILATRGGWAEVRLGGDGTGWVMKSALTASPAEQAGASDSVRFKNPPSPIYNAGGAHGEIVLEASVDTSGNVIGVKTLRNTTGSKSLEIQNMAELQRSSFYPLKVGGRLRPFVYEYRIRY